MHYINLYIINILFILYIFFRHDKELENSQWISLTIHEMRKKISATIMDDENKNDLSPILYYGSDFLLTPEDWRDLISADHDSLPIDLPFVQLSANLLKRNIILLPILQKDIEDFKQQMLKEMSSLKDGLETERKARQALEKEV